MEETTRHFVCNYPHCMAAFGTRYNLRRHIEARHLGIKKFSCDICGLRLASKQTKEEHMYTHTGEKPYKCTVPDCQKDFRQSSQLSNHMKQHQAREIEYLRPLPLILDSRKEEQENLKLPIPAILR